MAQARNHARLHSAEVMADTSQIEELEAKIRGAVQNARWNHMSKDAIKAVVTTALLKEGIK